MSAAAEQIPHGISYKVSAVADRPAQRSGSAHAKYSVSHHMVIKPFLLLGLAAEYRSWRWMWLTVVRRPSEVYDTHQRHKLTAPETISRSRDMVENCRLNLPYLYLGVTPLEFRLDFWRQKTRVPELSYSVICVILGLAISVEHQLVTNRQTNTR